MTNDSGTDWLTDTTTGIIWRDLLEMAFLEFVLYLGQRLRSVLGVNLWDNRGHFLGVYSAGFPQAWY